MTTEGQGRPGPGPPAPLRGCRRQPEAKAESAAALAFLDYACVGSDQIDGTTDALAGDITERGVPEALVQTALVTWGALDIIVNNAGYSLNGPFTQMTDERWHRMFDVHVTAPMAILRAAAPHLLGHVAHERAEGRGLPQNR